MPLRTTPYRGSEKPKGMYVETIKSFGREFLTEMRTGKVTTDVEGTVCRLCLRSGLRAILIFGRTKDSEELRARILDCCPVQLREDELFLPRSICEQCHEKLTAVHEFRELCRRSERELCRSHGREMRVDPTNGGRHFRDASIQTDSVDRVTLPTISPFSFEKNWSKEKKVWNEGEEKQREDAKGARDEKSTKEGAREGGREIESTVTEKQERPRGEGRGERAKKTSEKQYLCDVCSKTFASKSGLRFHSKTHDGVKPYLCRYCGKGFAIPSYAKRHERIHGAAERFVCHVCSASFASANGFRYHSRSHTGEANYRCDICGKSFGRCKYLKEHVFTHTGERPFACKTCGNAYGSSGSLFAHQRRCKSRPVSVALEEDAKGSAVMSSDRPG